MSYIFVTVLVIVNYGTS